MIDKLLAIFGVSMIRYFIMAGFAFLLFYKFFPRKMESSKIQKNKAPAKSFKRDIWYSVQTTIILAVITYVVLFTPFKNYTKIYVLKSDYPVWWFWLSLPVCLIIHDTYFYWMHRLLHVKSIFPYVHLLHHKSNNPSPWTSYSFHFFEAWMEGGVLICIVFLIPVHPAVLGMFVIVAFAINVYGHLGYEIAPKWFRKTWMFGILNTSVHHNLHHHKFKGNYGLYFRIWDRLLKTEHPDYVTEYDKVQNRRV